MNNSYENPKNMFWYITCTNMETVKNFMISSFITLYAPEDWLLIYEAKEKYRKLIKNFNRQIC